jgi:hypothetical protein
MDSDSNNIILKKTLRGRPKGVKDSKPRYHVMKLNISDVNNTHWENIGEFATVEQIATALNQSKHTIGAYVSGKIRTPFNLKITKV